MAEFVAQDRREFVVFRGDGFLEAALELGALAHCGLGGGECGTHLAERLDLGGLVESLGGAAVGEPAAEGFETFVDDVNRGVGFFGAHGHGGEGLGFQDEQLAAVGFERLAICVVAGQYGAKRDRAEVAGRVAKGTAVLIDGHACDASLDVLSGLVANLGAFFGGEGEGTFVLIAGLATGGGAVVRRGVVLGIWVTARVFAWLALAVLEGVASRVAGGGQEARIREILAVLEEVLIVLGDCGAVFEVVEEALEAVWALAIGPAVGVHLEDSKVDADLDELHAVGSFEESRGDLARLVGPVVEDGGEVVGHSHFCEVAFHAHPRWTIRNDAGLDLCFVVEK